MGELARIFYRDDLLPTGVSRTRVHASFARVTLSVNSGEVKEVKRLSGSGDHIIGQRSADFDERGFRTRLRAVGRALVSYMRTREGSPSREALRPYLEWLRVEPHLMREIEGYAPDFFAWLRLND